MSQYHILQLLTDFLQYLDDWKRIARDKKNKNLFIAPQTHTGFKVTLNSALQLHTFLTEHCGYEYFMTSRMNQDSLEVNF